MSAVNWTREQKQVIESRGKHLLVSAAAGSGKTAVLVERIIQMVTEGEHPLDIDQLLVMTFTNAAAAEMRERIGAAIEQKLAMHPDDAHLQMQATLVHHAKITTIDSFCLSIIRNHFQALDIDPSFRIGDEGELKLMQADVMAELLEAHYESGDAQFEHFVETFASGKSDAGIEDLILQVYLFAQSNPDPSVWIMECKQELQCDALTELETCHWMQFLKSDLKRQTEELYLQLRDAEELCETEGLLAAYLPMLQSDAEQLQRIAQAETFVEMHRHLLSVNWMRLATIRGKEVDAEKKAYVTNCRDRVKKAVGKLRELYCFEEPEEMLLDMEKTAGTVEVLLDLAEEFSDRYHEKKKERNIVDFNDLEHEALKVLTRREDGELIYTETADELSHQYAEVLVDEYQDSNLVQETLLRAVSRERFGQYNVFMVGDVKQSIYKFRLARPELFMEKYDTYEPYDTGTGMCRKIELHQNFRSREAVLEGINHVFYQIMTTNLGNIHYTEEAALHAGAVFAEPEEAIENRMAGVPELLIVDTGKDALGKLDEDAADYTAKEIEAKLIAKKIRQMVSLDQGMMVWDKHLNGTGGYRTAEFRDMVILLRSGTEWTETLLSVLMNEGIPAYAESRTGYFNTIEVETMLSLLSVIDNPMQDIPLTAVLRSPIVGMTDEELAELFAAYRKTTKKGQDRGIYAAVKLSVSDGRAPEKLDKFLKQLELFRQKSHYLSIHELIYDIYGETGYYDYASAMPAGDTRRGNLDMLVEKAAAYEKTSYKGLFHFVRYIENLKKYHTDFGEAATLGEEDNTVRIMSIHKSKGLEFPIVFLAGMGKKFNKQDTYGKVLIDPELGIAAEHLDLAQRLKTTTLKKNVLRRKMELDNLGEELRVLYVAMTRAKEQLIMTGTDRYLEKTLEKYRSVPHTEGQIPYTILATAGSYLDWLLMSIGEGTPYMKLTEVPVEELVGEEFVRQLQTRTTKEKLLHPESCHLWDSLQAEDSAREWNTDSDEDERAALAARLSYQYPHEAEVHLHTKMSVSELKQRGQFVDEDESVCQEGPYDWKWDDVLEKEMPIVEKPKAQEECETGAARGTAYHAFLEYLPFHEIKAQNDIRAYLQKCVIEKKLSALDARSIEVKDIWKFLQSPLGQRMSHAQAEGRLFKEQQFVMGTPAREMGAGDTDELVVIQGIIDAYFEENGKLVLVDYKTDRVKEAQTLLHHYQGQLAYYQRALEQITGRTVKEKLIYSFTLESEIVVD